MTPDWNIGDRAVCIANFVPSPTHITEGYPKKDSIYIVTGLTMDIYGILGLQLADCRTWGCKRILGFKVKVEEVGFCAQFFRKLVPECDRVRQEREAKQ